MDDLWFFLSYARSAVVGEPYLKRFHDDLAREIRISAGLPTQTAPEAIGFIDSESVEPGDRWPDRVSSALGVTRTLVCMYSLAYFNSEYCGKEFAVFRSRLAKDGGPGASTTLVVPVLWDAPDHLPPLPDAVSDIEYLHHRFGEVYAREGLRYLMMLNKHDDDYKEFVTQVARAIIRRGKETPIPPLKALAPLREIGSAWDATSSSAGSDASSVRPISLSGGISVVRFVFVAAHSRELRGIRRVLEAYDVKGGRYWKPYFPDETAIGVLSQRIASAEKLHYETLPVNDELVREIERAEEEQTIVIVVIDPWTAGVEPYRRHMQTCDRRTFVNCALMVPWNERDSETAQERERLRATLSQTLSRHVVVNTASLHGAIGSLEELEAQLGLAINEMRSRISRHTEVVHRLTGSSDIPLPQVQGPRLAS